VPVVAIKGRSKRQELSWGNAIRSRWPITAQAVTDLPVVGLVNEGSKAGPRATQAPRQGGLIRWRRSCVRPGVRRAGRRCAGRC